MKQYILRLDDASDYMDIEKWKRIEDLLDEFSIKPIVGIIPKNEDPSLVSQYEKNADFWNLVHSWIRKGWVPAMHGYEHKYVTKDGGINPVHYRSEFAGLSYEEQAEKIRRGYKILQEKGIEPKIFFAPSHTFDNNTLQALKDCTPIRIISDTVANDIYSKWDFCFIPQQSGIVRNLPFKVSTFCYHPNEMDTSQMERLRDFLRKNIKKFGEISYDIKKRKENIVDRWLRKMYFIKRKI